MSDHFYATPIEVARVYGESLYRLPGREFFPELEVNYLCMCLTRGGKPVYPGTSTPYRGRIRRHSFLIAPADHAKSTQALDFLHTFANARNVIDAPSDHDGPVYATLTSDTTWESFRGGVQEKAFVTPILPRIDYLVAEEALAYLGHRPDTIMTQAGRLLDPLESGNVYFGQKQAAALPRKAKEEFARNCGDGVKFNPDSGAFHLICHFSAVFCSHSFAPRIEQSLHETGFRGRFAEAIVDSTDAEFESYISSPYGDINEEAKEALIAYNRMAWRATFGTKNLPDRAIILKVINRIVQQYRDLAHATGKSLEEVYPKRTYQNVVQLLLAHAFSDALGRMGRVPDDEPVHIEQLYYTQDTIDRVEEWLVRAAIREEMRIEQTEMTNHILSEAIKLLNDFLGQRLRNYRTEREAIRKRIAEDPIYAEEMEAMDFETPQPAPYEFFTRGEFSDYITAHKAPSPTTRIAKLEKAGYISRVEARLASSTGLREAGGKKLTYRAAPHVVHKLGVRTYDELLEDMHPEPDEDTLYLDEEFKHYIEGSGNAWLKESLPY